MTKNTFFTELESASLSYCLMCVLVRQMIFYAREEWLFSLPMTFRNASHPLNKLSDCIVVGRLPENIKYLLKSYSSDNDLMAHLSKSLLDIDNINSPEYFCTGVIGCLCDGYAVVSSDMVKEYCMSFYERIANIYMCTNGINTYKSYVYAMKEIRDLFRKSAFVAQIEKDIGNTGWKKIADLHLGLMYSNFETACAHFSDNEDFSVLVDVGRYILLGSVAAAAYVSLVSDAKDFESNHAKGTVVDLRNEYEKIISCVEVDLLPFLNNQRDKKYGWVEQDDLRHELNKFVKKLKAQRKWLEVLDSARKHDLAMLVLRVRHAISQTKIAEKGDEMAIKWIELIARIVSIEASPKVISNWLDKYQAFRGRIPDKYGREWIEIGGERFLF